MPPRKPGGKYRGLVTRTKGESTRQAEAEAQARRDQELYNKQKQEQHQRRLLAASGMKHARRSEEDEAKQRVLNMLMGGRKNGLRKFFQGWVVGVETYQIEDNMKARQESWRRACGHVHTGKANCDECAFMELKDPIFLLPGDLLRRRRAAEAWSLAGPRGATHGTAELRVTKSTGALPLLVPLDETRTEVTQEDTFLDGEVKEVSHHATGRRSFIDSRHRMSFLPPANSGFSPSLSLGQAPLRRQSSRVVPRFLEATGDVI
jgi:hypothetical protein